LILPEYDFTNKFQKEDGRMRKLSMAVVAVVLFVFWSCSMGIAADKKQYSASPPEKIAKKCRIGYYEGGPYGEYQRVLSSIIDGLSELGWIEPVTIPAQENDKDTDKIWAWMAANAKSKYLEFISDAHYSSNWNKESREENRQLFLNRLKEKQDIDLIIAMGTWAGQDLANNDHSVPTIVCGVSDAITANIVKSTHDSGYDHVHAHMDPGRYDRQIRAFHDVIGFKKLGAVFMDTVDGRSVAAIEIIEKIAGERDFEKIECPYAYHEDIEARRQAFLECLQKIAPQIDAFYITQQSAVSFETLPKILEVLNQHKIPSFSQGGSDEVKHGVLLSVSASSSLKSYGKFYAETIAKVINGAKPRDLEQVYEAPVKIAFNKAEAKLIDLRDDTYDLLAGIAEEVYDNIETGK
jgi:ABC-type uncharacterized transport system substrate-binding protein